MIPHVDLPWGRDRFRLFRDGRVLNRDTGRTRYMPPNHQLKIGGKYRNIKRLVAQYWLDPYLDDDDVVRLIDPEGGIGAANLYVQRKDAFYEEIVEHGQEALQRYWETAPERRRGYIYPVDHPARARAIAKHEAKLAERRTA